MSLDKVFASITHGKSTDCRLANAHLAEQLERYNFGAYLVEKNCFRCPNNDCNLSYLFIFLRRDFFRLKHFVRFDVRPSYVIHKSVKELFTLDEQIRQDAVAKLSIGIQACPQTANQEVDACPETRVSYVQTDFMVGKHDNGNQTEGVIVADMGCQVFLEPEEAVVSPKLVNPSSAKLIDAVVDINDNLPPNSEGVLTSSTTGVVPCQQTSLADHTYASVEPAQHIRVPDVQHTTSPKCSLEIQQDDDDDDVVFIEVRRNPARLPKEVKIEAQEEEQQEVEPSQPVLERVVKEEPVDEQEPIQSVEPDNNSVERISDAMSSAVLLTPKTYSSRDSTFEGSAKRMKFSNVEMCDTCLDVTHFSSLEEYCVHVLEVHVSLVRFKCTACSSRFFTSQQAARHVQKHSSPDGKTNPTFEDLISKEIPRDHLAKFVKSANMCYPDKFRNIPIERLVEIIHEIP